MKSPKYTFLAFCILALAITACHKDEPLNTNANNNSVSLQFNGTTYKSTGLTAIDSVGKLQIAGVVNSTTSIYLAAAGGFKVGSYDIASGTAAATFTAGATNVYTATSGTITVTAVNSASISGTFNFISTDAAGDTTGTATNGAFETTYITK